MAFFSFTQPKPSIVFNKRFYTVYYAAIVLIFSCQSKTDMSSRSAAIQWGGFNDEKFIWISRYDKNTPLLIIDKGDSMVLDTIVPSGLSKFIRKSKFEIISNNTYNDTTFIFDRIQEGSQTVPKPEAIRRAKVDSIYHQVLFDQPNVKKIQTNHLMGDNLIIGSTDNLNLDINDCHFRNILIHNPEQYDEYIEPEEIEFPEIQFSEHNSKKTDVPFSRKISFSYFNINKLPVLNENSVKFVSCSISRETKLNFSNADTVELRKLRFISSDDALELISTKKAKIILILEDVGIKRLKFNPAQFQAQYVLTKPLNKKH